MVAEFCKGERSGDVLGTKTAGNVLGAANFKLAEDYWLRFPIFGWMTWRGACLEGSGVLPDVQVEVEPERILRGDDQQMTTALDIMSGWKTS